MRSILFGIWKRLPFSMQGVLARFVRPSFLIFASAVIINRDKQILLEKLTYQNIHPWGLPGGNLDYGEEPEDAVVRETREELGLEIEVKRFLAAKNANDRDILGLFYWCTTESNSFHLGPEVSEVKFFALSDLPDVRPSDITFLRQLSEMVTSFEHELA
jgi:8-oxo-dGTP diphosphatase